MAFTQSTFATVGAQSTDTPSVYSYRTPDTLAQVKATDYFLDKSQQLEQGDFILAEASDSSGMLEVLTDRSSAATATFVQRIDNREVINKASDFPTTVGGKIPLVANTEYWIGSDSVSVPDEFTLASNVTFSGANGASKLTYTGTGDMFEGGGVDLLTIKNLALDLPNGGFVFGITDTVQNTVVNLLDYRVISCGGLGTVTGVLAFVMEFGTIFDMDQGIVIAGSVVVISVDKLFGFSTKATFKAVDLGSSVASTLEFNNMALNAPSGAIGISGLANNGNVSSGSVAAVDSCEFLGGMTALETITKDDVRWNYNNSPPIPDTNPDALISLNDNSTETVISDSSTDGSNAVLVAGTWVTQRQSHFTSTAAGRVVYVGEKDLAVPVTIQATVEAASGTNKDMAIYLAVDGVVVGAARSKNKVGQNDPRTLSIPWQLNFIEDKFIEVFVENQTDAINMVVTDAVMRAR